MRLSLLALAVVALALPATSASSVPAKTLGSISGRPRQETGLDGRRQLRFIPRMYPRACERGRLARAESARGIRGCL